MALFSSYPQRALKCLFLCECFIYAFKHLLGTYYEQRTLKLCVVILMDHMHSLYLLSGWGRYKHQIHLVKNGLTWAPQKVWDRIPSPGKQTSSCWNATYPRVGEGALGWGLRESRGGEDGCVFWREWWRDGRYPEITEHVLNSRENNVNP